MAVHSFPRERLKVLLLEGIHPTAVAAFEEAGYTTVERREGTVPEADLQALLADVHFLGIRSRTHLSEAMLAAAPKLVAVGAFCIGTNQIDLAAAARRGVAVFNAPFSNTRSVAELVLAEAILLLRGVPEKNSRAHRGVWDKRADAHEIRGKTLGIVGYGNIGSQLSVLAEALGMQVRFYDVAAKLPLGNAVAGASLDDVLAASDVVTLHVPETPETHRMIGAAELSRMRPGAVLINASRGTVVDLDALADALAEGHLRGAAIDVFPVEPRTNEEPFETPLQPFDNVILTPHIGGSTVEAQANIGREVAGKLVRYSDNGSTMTSVNFPEVSLPPHPGLHRLLHVHENRPGVMSAVNRVFSEIGANVAGQSLQTRGSIGYVVIDVDTASSDAALAALQAVPGTLRARLLF
ncbi:MAG: phosphoglycerate dehydrogenase [Rubricoccaceae bacterium]|nr:phosphoglycerate dehydrogenase [Rubricoccaceae bacterium]